MIDSISNAGNIVIIACKAFKHELDKILAELCFKGRTIYIQTDKLHHSPKLLKEELVKLLDNIDGTVEEVIIAFGQRCFPEIQAICNLRGAQLIGSENCYHLFLGEKYFRLLKEEPGTYFLDRFLSENFESFCKYALGLERFPEFKDVIFSHYKRAIYIDLNHEGITRDAESAAAYIGIPVQVVNGDPNRLKKVIRQVLASIR